MIDGSGKTWFDEGLLVYSGETLRKSPSFERVWNAQFNADKPCGPTRRSPGNRGDRALERQFARDDSTINSTNRNAANCPRKRKAADFRSIENPRESVDFPKDNEPSASGFDEEECIIIKEVSRVRQTSEDDISRPLPVQQQPQQSPSSTHEQRSSSAPAPKRILLTSPEIRHPRPQSSQRWRGLSSTPAILSQQNVNPEVIAAEPASLPSKGRPNDKAKSRQRGLRSKMMSQKFTVACCIVIQRGTRWVRLPMDCFQSQTVLDFFRAYSQTSGVDEVPMVRFEMLDCIMDVPRGDERSFQNLKQAIQDTLLKHMQKNPASSCFWVYATSPQPSVDFSNRFDSSKSSGGVAQEQLAPKSDLRAASLAPLGQRLDGRANGPSSSMQVAVRIQIDARGKFSRRYNSAVLNLQTTNVEFFAWFASQTGYAAPSGPPALRFTFKDAMPTPKSSDIELGNEERFGLMKLDIKAQCELAAAYMPELFEFAILITASDWTVQSQVYDW